MSKRVSSLWFRRAYPELTAEELTRRAQWLTGCFNLIPWADYGAREAMIHSLNGWQSLDGVWWVDTVIIRNSPCPYDAHPPQVNFHEMSFGDLLRTGPPQA